MRASFDDPSVVSHPGLVPVMRLAQSCGLHTVVAEGVRVPADKGSNAAGKIAHDRGRDAHRGRLDR
jgi:hypothetical protein